jgi:hypothetical protein
VTAALRLLKRGHGEQDVQLEEIVALSIGVAAAILFPIVALIVHQRRERRHNRRMGGRRTDKIRLTDRS